MQSRAGLQAQSPIHCLCPSTATMQRLWRHFHADSLWQRLNFISLHRPQLRRCLIAPFALMRAWWDI